MSNEATNREAIAEALDDLVMSKGIALDEARLDWLTEWVAQRIALATRALCPVCGGAGIVDTSPPGVETAPWLATDTDCPACADTEDTP